jgi:hypothetical protein
MLNKSFKFSKILFIFFILFNFIFSNHLFAQQKDSTLMDESIVDLGIVAGTCAAGSILGLSTLPFMSEPSKHYKNIIAGGSVGIIVGVLLVAWIQANKSQDRIGHNLMKEAPINNWDLNNRIAMNQIDETILSKKNPAQNALFHLNLNFDF